MKKIIALVMALAMLSSLFVMTGSAEEKTEVKTVTPGVLTVATSPDFAPMEFVDATKEGQDMFVGFDVTQAKLSCLALIKALRCYKI